MTSQAALRVSVVVTVLNEAATLGDLLAGLEAQHRTPDEVVVVDGGSRDGTVELLERYTGPLALRWEVLPGCTIAAGRNHGINLARWEVIAVTDAGVRLPPGWLAALTEPFATGSSVEAVAGFFAADPRSLFEVALGATTLPDAGEIDPAGFLPSSRSVAFTKTLWARAGGYPGWLDYGEDLVFDLRVRATGAVFAWAPAATVLFRPRRDLRAFFLQYYRYARGDGKAGLWPRRHLVRYLAYLALASAAMAPPGGGRAVVRVLIGTGVVAYLARPVRRLWVLSVRRRPVALLAVFALVPVIRLVGDAAKMLGYPVGVLWRLRRGGTAGRRGGGMRRD